MKLGVVITDQALTGAAGELLREAAERGHDLRCFLTDSGVRALDDAGVRSLLKGGSLHLAVCELSLERFRQHVPQAVGDAVIVGGQYQDAELAHWSDRVVVF